MVYTWFIHGHLWFIHGHLWFIHGYKGFFMRKILPDIPPAEGESPDYDTLHIATCDFTDFAVFEVEALSDHWLINLMHYLELTTFFDDLREYNEEIVRKSGRYLLPDEVNGFISDIVVVTIKANQRNTYHIKLEEKLESIERHRGVPRLQYTT